MVDGASLLMQMTWAFYGQGRWADARGANLLDGGAPVLRHLHVRRRPARRRRPAGAAVLRRSCSTGSASTRPTLPAQDDVAGWPALRARFTEAFATRTRDEWAAVFDGTEACVTPVLALGEVADHPHMKARGTVVAPDGVPQAAPAPRFSRTPATLPGPPAEPEDVETVLADWAADATERRHPAAHMGDGVPAACVRRTGCRPPAGCGCGSGRRGCPGPSSSRP